MSFTFKKQIFGFLDLLRFKKMVPNRRKKLEEGSSSPLPVSYAVNETAKILHPGYQKAILEKIEINTADTKTYHFITEHPFYFEAGEYVSLAAKIEGSDVSRPYAISSSPKEALEKKVSLTIKKVGFFSTYMFDKAKVGDTFLLGDPSGNFVYEPLKDAKHVLALAGGSGITPFYSMAQAIRDQINDYDLTIIYGAKTEKDLIFKEELDTLKSSRVHVVYVLSEEKKEGYQHGFITKEILEPYMKEDVTVMMCGPEAMYEFVTKELESFHLPIRRVKKEANCVASRKGEEKTYQLTVHIGFDTFQVPASSNETILVALERASLPVPSKCRAGGCGFCHSKLVSGKYTIAGTDKRRLADLKFGYIHPCCTYPDSDMELIVPKREEIH